MEFLWSLRMIIVHDVMRFVGEGVKSSSIKGEARAQCAIIVA